MIDFHSQLSIIPQVYNSAELQDNLEHSGGITISWNSATDAEIPLGSYVTYRCIRYILLEKYAPAKSGSTHYRYEPTFRHPQNMLDRIPFWIKSKDADGNPVNLETTAYTGYPYIIAQKLCSFINTEYWNETGDNFFRQTIGTGWTYDIPRTLNSEGVVQSSRVIITVSFDGCSIKSAANAIADAMGCNVFFDWSAKTIRFVVGTTIQGETYNCFHVLGGTTNMGKTTTSGGYAVVTQRMTLREPNGGGTSEDITINGKTFQLLKGSIISGAGDGIRLITDLIFDNIYPKQVLYIKSARQRLCYLTDENGERIVDDAQAGTFKTFAKWYLTFATSKNDSAASTWPSYVFDQSLLIQDMPLGLLFQIDYDNPQDMSSLVGQEFEMTYYPTQQHEKDKIDVDSQGFTVEAGEFYVAVKAQGNIILPCTAGTISKGTVDYAYSSVGGFPPASANVVGKLAIANGVNRIYECQAVSAGAYDWVPKSDLIGTDEGYVVRHGNLNGSFMSTDVLANHLIVWNATSDEWTDGGVYSGLFPNVGDKVTLLNMALSDTQKSNAKQELLDAAKEIIGAMITPSGEYQEQVIFADEVGGVQPDNTIPFKEIGSESPFGEGHGPIVTNINQNLDTNVAEVTVGSWARKTKTGGTVDKIDTVNISTGSSTTGGSAYGDGTIGDGGGYTPGGNSSNEQQTINQTVPKADTLFMASLSSVISSVPCTNGNLVKADTDIYTKVSAFYGTNDTTANCNIRLRSNIGIVTVYIGTAATTVATKTQLTTEAKPMSNQNQWIRIHVEMGANIGAKVEVPFIVSHPMFDARNLTFVVDAQPEGAPGQPGRDGSDGGNTATVYLYKRGESVDDVWGDSTTAAKKRPNITLYYDFAEKQLYKGATGKIVPSSEELGGWSLTLPYGTEKVFVTAAVAYSITATDDIGTNEWVTPVQYTGEDGQPGAHGINSAIVFLYRRYAPTTQNPTPAKPQQTMWYKFEDGKLYTRSGSAEPYTYTEVVDGDAILNGWHREIPDVNGDPCFVIQAAALSSENYDAIEVDSTTTPKKDDWSGVIKLVEDGKNSVRLDLSNMQDLIQVGSDGKIVTARSISTEIRLYKGSVLTAFTTPTNAELASALTISYNDANGQTKSLVPTITESGKVKTVTWAFTNAMWLLESSITKPVSVTFEGTPYVSNFVITTTKDAVIYQLAPSVKASVFSRQADNSLAPASIEVECGYTQIEASGTTGYAWPSATNGYIGGMNKFPLIVVRRIGSDGNPVPTFGNVQTLGWDYTHSTNQNDSDLIRTEAGKIKIPSTTSYIAIEYGICWKNPQDAAMADITDIQSVSIIKGGEHGDGIDGITRTYAVSAHNAPDSPSTQEWPTDIESWSVTSPPVTDAKPYLWVKEVVDYKYGADAESYYYIGKKGDNGVDAQDVEWAYIRTMTPIAPSITDDSTYTDSHTPARDFTEDDHMPHIANGNSDIENNKNKYECTDDPKGVNDTWKYEWEIKREKGTATNGRRNWQPYNGKMTLHNNLAESALVIDIDNDNDQFGTDSTSRVLDAQTRTTNVTMLYGTQQQAFTSPPTANIYWDNGNELTSSEKTDVANVSVSPQTANQTSYAVSVSIKKTSDAATTMPWASHNGCYVVITGTCAKGGPKTIRFTLEKVMSGQAGVSPTIYQLAPTLKAFNFTRLANNDLSPNSITSQIKVAETIGNTTNIETLSDSGKTFTWGFDGSFTGGTISEGDKIIVSNSDASQHREVCVELSTGDRETLPITKDGANGQNGAPGGNTATLYLYKRSATNPNNRPNQKLWYLFSAKKLYTDAACTTELVSSNGWSPTIPSGSTDPIWVTAAIAYSITDVDDITASEWVTPVQFTANGQNGNDGAHGINSAIIFIYKRSEQAPAENPKDVPSGNITYTFATGEKVLEQGKSMNDWSFVIPSANGYPCYVRQQAALGSGDTDVLEQSQWSTATKLVEDGKNSVRIDLSNQADMVSCDIDGKLMFDRTIGTTARIYDGAQPVTGGVTVTAATITVTRGGTSTTLSSQPTYGNNGAGFSWSLLKGDILSGASVEVEITLTYKTVPYSIIFPLTRTDLPFVPQVTVSKNEIAFKRQSDGTLSPASVDVTCGYSISDANGTTPHAWPTGGSFMLNGITYHLIWRRYDASGAVIPTYGGDQPYGWDRTYANDSGQSQAVDAYTDRIDGGVTVKNTTPYTAYEFALSTKMPSQANDTTDIIDRETVPVVRDGAKGADGTSVLGQYSVDGSSGWHYGYSSNDRYMRTSTDGGSTWSDGVKIVGEKGAETEYSFNISQNLTSTDVNTPPENCISQNWQGAPIATTQDYPYLWCKEVRHNYVNGVDQPGRAYYYRLTGENGSNGSVVTIGDNKHWYIDGVDTNIIAEGQNGTGIQLKGTVDVVMNADLPNPNPDDKTSLEGLSGTVTLTYGDCYMVEENGWLYFYDGTTPASPATETKPANPFGWNPVGEIKGEPGEDGTTYYYHVAFASSITYNNNGVVTAQSGFTTVNNSETGYPWVGYCATTEVKDPGWDATTEQDKLTAAKKYKWNYQAGSSPWVADLDNEMDSVACDKNGHPAAETALTTNLSLYYGSENAKFKVKSLKRNGGGSGDMGTGVIYVMDTVLSGTLPTPLATSHNLLLRYYPSATINGKDDFEIVLATSDNSITRTLHFTVNGVRPGANGEPAVVYKLIPSASIIKITKNGTLSPSSISCDVEKVAGSSTSRATSSDGTLRYSIDNDITEYTEGTELQINTETVTPSDSNSFVTFVFVVGQQIRDKERIPVVSDGDDGPQGLTGPQGPTGPQGFGNTLTLNRDGLYTEAAFNSYGLIGKQESYTRRDCDKEITGYDDSGNPVYGSVIDFTTKVRVGDIFIVTGKSKDALIMHDISYKCTQVQADMIWGECVSHIKDGAKGGKGDRGASVRGPRDWDSIILDQTADKHFYQGADGEQFIDIVSYAKTSTEDAKFYQCILSYEANHNPLQAVSPKDDTEHWKVATHFDFIATKLIYSLWGEIERLKTQFLEVTNLQYNSSKVIMSPETPFMVLDKAGRTAIKIAIDEATDNAYIDIYEGGNKVGRINSSLFNLTASNDSWAKIGTWKYFESMPSWLNVSNIPTSEATVNGWQFSAGYYTQGDIKTYYLGDEYQDYDQHVFNSNAMGTGANEHRPAGTKLNGWYAKANNGVHFINQNTLKQTEFVYKYTQGVLTATIELSEP